MKEYVELKNKINNIIEQANSDKPACKNCKNYCDGVCSFGSVNERNGNRYLFNNGKITTPDYFCDNFDIIYNLSESTKEILSNLIKDIEKVNEGVMNLELLLSGKIKEEDFNEIMK